MAQKTIAFAILTLCVSAVFGQDLTVKSGTYYEIGGLPKHVEVAGRLLFDAIPSGQPVPVGVIRVETQAANVEVIASDVNRNPVEVERLTAETYAISKPGKFWVDVTAIDFAKNLYGRKTVLVEVGGSPKPDPPGPGPTPDPNSDDFDGLASRVSIHASKLGMDQRSQIAGILGNAADKMRTFEFKQVQQTKEYLARNWPPCTSPDCKALWDLVMADASQRMLSWQETQDYYRIVAQGVLQ